MIASHNSYPTEDFSGKFFQELLGEVRDFLGEEFYSEFSEVKNRREQFLGERWDRSAHSDGLESFREIDYDHLSTLIRKKLTNDRAKLIEVYFRMISIALRYGEYQRAEEILGFLSSQIPNNSALERAQWHNKKGQLKFLKNQFQQSLDAYQTALELSETLDDEIGVLKAYNNLGIVSHEQWNLETGAKYFQKAQALLRNSEISPDDDIAIKVPMNLGIVEAIRGNNNSAVTIFSELETKLPEKLQQTKALVIGNKGIALKDLGRYKEAVATLEKALQVAEEISFVRWIGYMSLNLAEVHILHGEMQSGQSRLVEAFRIFTQLRDRPRIGDSYRIFGVLHRENEEFDVAGSYFDISLDIARDFDNLLFLCDTNYEYGILYQLQGDSERAREYLEASYQHAKAMQASGRQQKISNILDSIE